MELIVNNAYRTKTGELVVFLGYQDGALRETHGLFRSLNDLNTFFPLRLDEIDVDNRG